MFRSALTTTLTTLVAFGLAASTFAGPAKQDKPAPSSQKWASGEVERVDQTGGTLVVKQGAHEMTFVLAKDVKLKEGKRAMTQAELGTAVGHHATVRYTTNGSQKTAHSVEIEAPHAAKKAQKPTE